MSRKEFENLICSFLAQVFEELFLRADAEKLVESYLQVLRTEVYGKSEVSFVFDF